MTQDSVPMTSPPPHGPRPWTARVADWAAWLVPRAVGLLFLYTGISKGWDPTRTQRVLAFDGVPEPLVAPMTYLVSAWEIALGAALLAGFARRRAIAATILLLLVYSVQLAYLYVSQNPPEDCACITIFRRYASAKQQLTLGLVRNAVLAAALEWVRLRLSAPTSKDEGGRGD